MSPATEHDISTSLPSGEEIPRARQNLAGNIGKNTIFGVLAGSTQIATRLVTIPIVIAHLGLGGYGIWSIIMTTAAYMRFGAVGVKSAFQKYVAEATGSGDYERANHLLSTGCAAMLGFSVLGLLPVFFWSTRLAQMAGVPGPFLGATSGAISVLALIMIMSNVGAVFEAIVMGGHRIDVVRRFGAGLAVVEAVAIVILLHFSYGLLAMASVMGTSEIVYVLCCFVASRRVVPRIRIASRYISKSVLPELFRFAGSYQLVSILQVSYAAIIPVTILRAFGAEHAGIYALSARLISPAQMLEDSFLLSILSGGAMVYASGATEKMKELLHKSFKITFAFALIPMSFIACFGPMIVFAWTGQSAAEFQTTLILVSITGAFQAVSTLGLVLYRISGNALLDNLRQVLVLAALLLAAAFANKLGFYGVLAGLAFSELIGMLFMIYAVTRTFRLFRPRTIFADGLKALGAGAGIIFVGLAMTRVPLPIADARAAAAVRAVLILGVCALATLPALLLSKFIDFTEGQTVFRAVFPRTKAAVPRTVFEAE